jgi:putative dehydrogenase
MCLRQFDEGNSSPVLPDFVMAWPASRELGGHESRIFGGPAHAVTRTLTLCTAGPNSSKERVRPLFEAMGAERVFDFGEAIGAGTATKLAGNFLIISGFVALQEAFEVLRAGGIDPKPTLEMLTTTLVATPGNQRYAGALLSGQVPTSAIPEKDIGLFRLFAETAHAKTPLSERMQEILAGDEAGVAIPSVC